MFIQNTLPTIVGINSGSVQLRLMPGINEVREEDLQQCKDNPLLKRLAEDGKLKLVDPPRAPVFEPSATEEPSDDAGKPDKKEGEAEQPNSLPGLKGISANDAIALVADTLDEEMLLRWLDEEQRTTVQAAIEKQLKKLDDAGKPDKKE